MRLDPALEAELVKEVDRRNDDDEDATTSRSTIVREALRAYLQPMAVGALGTLRLRDLRRMVRNAAKTIQPCYGAHEEVVESGAAPATQPSSAVQFTFTPCGKPSTHHDVRDGRYFCAEHAQIGALRLHLEVSLVARHDPLTPDTSRYGLEGPSPSSTRDRPGFMTSRAGV